MDRPKDVLALVSAIIISLALYLTLTPIRYAISSDLSAGLTQQRKALSDAFGKIDAQYRAKANAEVTRRENSEADKAQGQDAVLQMRKLIIKAGEEMNKFFYLTDPSALADWDGSEELDRYVNDASNNFIRVCNGDALPEGVRIDEKDPDLKPLMRVLDSVCKAFDSDRARNVIRAAYQQMEDSASPERFLRYGYLLAALLLYVAFFNTLTATTLSVIELLAFQSKPQQSANSPDPG